MGFTTGFLGGVTLTFSLAYLSVYVHRSNRTYQSLLLRQQAKLLTSHVDPPEPEYQPPAYRIEQAGLDEQLKDRWNREVESLVRRVQSTDWEALRVRWERRIGFAVNDLRETDAVQELEQKLKENIIGTEKPSEALQNSAKDAVQGKRLLDEK